MAGEVLEGLISNRTVLIPSILYYHEKTKLRERHYSFSCSHDCFFVLIVFSSCGQKKAQSIKDLDSRSDSLVVMIAAFVMLVVVIIVLIKRKYAHQANLA